MKLNEKIIYITQEINSDDTIVKHNGLEKIGIGETSRILDERFKEHTYRGSKSSVGIKIIDKIIVDDLSDKYIHEKLKSLGYFVAERHNTYDIQEVNNKTEVFTGVSNKKIEGIVDEGDEINLDLIKRIIEEKDPDVFKTELKLKPHQEDAYKFMIDKYNSGETDILLNHKARSGKSFISYHFLINNPYNIKNTLLLTQFPVLNGQWERELLSIKGHNINVINCSDLINDDVIHLDDDRPNLVMMSLQDAKGNDNDLNDNEIIEFLNKQKFSELKKINWDLLIFDEIHKGKETKKTDFLLNKLKYKKLLGLSATPTKNILRGSFKLENIHIYDLIEEKKYKDQYGRNVYNIPDIRFNLMKLNEIKDRLKYFTEEENFNFHKFFRIEDEQLYYYDDIQLFFKWIFTMDEFDGGSLSRIRRINGHILIFVENNKSQKLLVDCLKNIGGRFRNYDIHYTNSDVRNSKQLLNFIDQLENTNRKSIIFANQQLTTGITLRKCDSVMFMNDWKNMDTYIQASYRCQSPSKDKYIVDVYDFNPSRTFNILYDYIRNSSVKKTYDFNNSVKEFLRCSNVNIYEQGKFEEIDFDTFKNGIAENIKINSSNIFNSVSNFINIESINIDIKNDILKFGDLNNNKTKLNKIKLNEDAEEIGKNYKNEERELEEYNNGEDLSEKDYQKELDVIFNNIKYIVSKTPLLSLMTKFKYDNIDILLEKIDKDNDIKEMYINSLLLSTNLDTETIFNIIKKIYSNIDINNRLDDYLLFFNKKYDKIKKSYLENNDILMHIEDTIKLIDSFIGISESEKKLLGEVFTPFELINEMLDTLPEDVWSNPNLKILDPANGIGNFPIIIVKRLMDGLKSFEPDYNKRYKHIMENMIYVCDISPKNMFIYNNLFNPNNDIKLNSFRGSFLDDSFDKHMKEVWGIEKFDIVVGNPPYQEKVGVRKSEPIWDKFSSKSLLILNNNGYLNMVHPSSWRSPKGRFRYLYEMYINRYLVYLSMNNFKKGQSIFGVGTNFDFFCIKNTKNKKITKIKTIDDEFLELNLSDYKFIPNGKFDIFQKLIGKDNDKLVDVLYNRSSYGTDKNNVFKDNVNDFIYPCVYTITIKNGINLFYSNTNKNGHFGIPKVIWSNGLGTYPIIDKNGDYGLTQFSYAIIDDKDKLENIKKSMENDKFIKLMDYVKFTNNKYDYKVIQTFKKDFWKEFIY